MTIATQPLVLQALDALKMNQRRRAVSLLKKDLDQGPETGQRWQSFARLAGTIGHKTLELEGLRRFAQTPPQTLDNLLAYAQALSRLGRSAVAMTIIDGLPAEVQDHPAVLHFRGIVASETGDFAAAQTYLHRALEQAPTSGQTWHALSVAKTFTPTDPDLARMESLRASMAAAPPEVRSIFLYALGKAYDDVRDTARAMAAYDEGAALMRGAYDPAQWQATVTAIVRDFTPENLSRLKPSQCDSDRVIFVTGLPRSGTTLVEQILTAHSAVTGGDELNITDEILIPTGDRSFAGAMAYQERVKSADPWGDLARDYMEVVDDWFPGTQHVIDKTLNRSVIMGLLLHMLPKARVVWLRRDPEDNALSIYRTHFRNTTPWSWSLSDIAIYMKGEDILWRRWTRLFPGRILTVNYEELVASPEAETRRILGHVGLSEEPAVFAPHESQRSVMTASVAQVRAPISTGRIGAAQAYGAFMDEFRRIYSA